MANKKQEQTLQKFRNGQLNVLVTTNVLEEGVDIRNCNLVIRFDPATDFRSHVQVLNDILFIHIIYIFHLFSQVVEFAGRMEQFTFL